MEELKAFDYNAAKAIIDAFNSKHAQTDHLPAGGLYVTADFESLPLKVVPDEHATYSMYRLVVEEEDEEDEKEVTLYALGVLTQKLLPPFKPRRKYHPSRDALFKGFRQSVHIHGAGASSLERALQCAKFGFVLLERYAPKEATFPAESVSVENMVMSNPYFETGKDAKGRDKVLFSKLVDPFDELNRTQTEGCIHTADNDVQFLETYEDDRGALRHTHVNPTRLRPGDVVRVGFSLVVRQEKSFSTTTSNFELVLRSVTLVDDSLSSALSMKQLEEPADAGKKRSTVTRGTFDDEEEDRPIRKVRKAMSKLTITPSSMEVDKGEGSSAGDKGCA